MGDTAKRNKVLRGVGWSSLGSIVNYILLFSRTFILVRFLAPGDFGIMALSLLLVTIIKQFSGVGLEQAVIQAEVVTKQTIDTVWTVSIIRGFLFFGLLIIISPHYADYFDEPALIPILTILSSAAIFNGFRNSYIVGSEKALKFDLLFKLNIITAVVEFTTTIILVILYADAVALALGYITGSITGLILSFILFKERPNFNFSSSEFFKLFHFGKWVFGGGVLIFLILNIDTLVVGKALGVVLLGYYQIAFRIANFAATDIVLTFSKSLYPSYAFIRNDIVMLKNYFLTTIFLISVTILPLMILIGMFADSFVLLFIGNSWEEVIGPLKILLIFGTIRSFASVCGYIFWAVGRPKIQSIASLIQLILIAIIIVPLTYQYGISGSAMSVTMPLIFSFIISLYYTVKILKIGIDDCLHFLRTPLFASVSLVLTIFLIKSILPGVSSILMFVANAFFLGGLYLLYLFIFDYFGSQVGRNLLVTALNFLKKGQVSESRNG